MRHVIFCRSGRSDVFTDLVHSLLLDDERIKENSMANNFIDVCVVVSDAEYMIRSERKRWGGFLGGKKAQPNLHKGSYSWSVGGAGGGVLFCSDCSSCSWKFRSLVVSLSDPLRRKIVERRRLRRQCSHVRAPAMMVSTRIPMRISRIRLVFSKTEIKTNSVWLCAFSINQKNNNNYLTQQQQQQCWFLS